MNKEEFILELKKINIDITEDKLKKLEDFYKLLIEWNNKINLTTIIKKEDVYLKHFYDSLTLFKEINLNNNISLCDVGTGAGFPGIVLKIIFPNIDITLIDSLQKRVNYLNEIIKILNLESIKAYHVRMEDFSKVNIEKFDYITARAVSNLTMITEISVKSLKIGGKLVFMKAKCCDEINELKPRLPRYGLILKNINEFLLPFENSERTLIVLEKVKKTSDKFPRRIDIIKKKLAK